MHQVFDRLDELLAAARSRAADAAGTAAAWLRELADALEQETRGPAMAAAPADNTRALTLRNDCEHALRRLDGPAAPRGTQAGAGQPVAAVGPGLRLALQLALAFLNEWLRKQQEQPA